MVKLGSTLAAGPIIITIGRSARLSRRSASNLPTGRLRSIRCGIPTLRDCCCAAFRRLSSPSFMTHRSGKSSDTMQSISPTMPMPSCARRYSGRNGAATSSGSRADARRLAFLPPTRRSFFGDEDFFAETDFGRRQSLLFELEIIGRANPVPFAKFLDRIAVRLERRRRRDRLGLLLAAARHYALPFGGISATPPIAICML